MRSCAPGSGEDQIAGTLVLGQREQEIAGGQHQRAKRHAARLRARPASSPGDEQPGEHDQRIDRIDHRHGGQAELPVTEGGKELGAVNG